MTITYLLIHSFIIPLQMVHTYGPQDFVLLKEINTTTTTNIPNERRGKY